MDNKSGNENKNKFNCAGYTPVQIANFFLVMAFGEKKYKMTPLKLIKLVYFAYAWNLFLYDEKLFEEPIVMGTKGPIISSLKGCFAQYEDNIMPKTCLASGYDIETGNTYKEILKSDDEKVKLLSAVFKKYQDKTGNQLSNITHETGSPWQISKEEGLQMGNVISDELIYQRAEEFLTKEYGSDLTE